MAVGIVAEETNTPVIIHMQGYMEVYHLAADIVISLANWGGNVFHLLLNFPNILMVCVCLWKAV
mgnify:CR=1 FL=1